MAPAFGSARGNIHRLRHVGFLRLAAALVCLALAARASTARGAALPKHSEEFKRLRLDYYGLIDSIEHPEKWREAVAQQEAYVAKVREAQRQRPELRDELEALVRRAEAALAYDGIDVDGANRMHNAKWLDPFPGELDVVAWVEADHLRVAVCNPGDAAKKVAVRLGQYAKRTGVTDWPAVASTEVAVAPGEVVLVHFDGIPTTGNWRNDRRDSFQPSMALLEGGRQRDASGIFVRSAGPWGGEASRYVVASGKVEVVAPGARGIPYSHKHTLYVPKRARGRRGGASFPLRSADAGGLREAEHGYFVENRVARFTLTLPAADVCDVVCLPDLIARIHSGSLIMVDRAPGPRILHLGRNTRMRRVAAVLPAGSRLDAEPLSNDSARRVEQLVPRLATELWRVRSNAERQIAASSAHAVPKMVELLAHRGANTSSNVKRPDHRYEDSAKRTLTRIGEPAVEALAKVLRNPHWRPASDAAGVLGAIGGRGADALLRAATDPNPRIRQAALFGLGKTADPRRAAVVRRLVRDPDKAVRDRASALLPSVVDDAEAMAHILRQLASPEPEKRQWAIHELVRWQATGGWPAVNRTQDERAQHIARMLTDADADVRETAARALGTLCDPRGIPALLETTGDSRPAVRRAAAWAMGRICDVRKLGRETLGQEATSTLVTMLGDADEGVRTRVAYLLGELKVAEGAEPLIRALDAPSDSVRRAAQHALTLLGYQTEKLPGKERFRVVRPEQEEPLPRDIEGLLEWLGAKEGTRRAAARDALAERGKEAIEPLKRMLGDPRPLARLSAVEALSRIDLPAAREALIPLLGSGERLVAHRAAEALAKAPDPTMLPVWMKLLDSEDLTLRAAAAEALGRAGDRRAVQPLLAHLADPRTEARRKVIWALGELRDPRAEEPLFERFVNRRGGDRRAKPVYSKHDEYAADLDALQEALIKIGEPAIEDLIRATEFGWSSVQEKATEALVQIGKPAVVPLIAALQGVDQRARAGAAKTLGKLKPPDAVRPLIEAVGDHQDYVSQKAFEALIAYGEAARPTLEKAVNDARLRLMGRASAAVLLMGLGDASGQHIIASVVETGTTSQMNTIASRMGKTRKKEFLPLLENALARRDAWQGVAYAVAYCGGRDAIPILERALSHPHKGVRSGARGWIKRLSE